MKTTHTEQMGRFMYQRMSPLHKTHLEDGTTEITWSVDYRCNRCGLETTQERTGTRESAMQPFDHPRTDCKKYLRHCLWCSKTFRSEDASTTNCGEPECVKHQTDVVPTWDKDRWDNVDPVDPADIPSVDGQRLRIHRELVWAVCNLLEHVEVNGFDGEEVESLCDNLRMIVE